VNPLIWDWDAPTASAVSGQVCTDGTYVYVETRDSSNVHYLAKYNASTLTRLAYQTFTQATGVAQNWSGPLMTNGTYLVAAAVDGVHVFLCSDMSYVGRAYQTATAGDLAPSGFIGSIGYWDGTSFWFGGLAFAGHNHALNKLTPGANIGSWTFTQLGTVALGSSYHTRTVLPVGTDIFIVSNNLAGIIRLSKSGNIVWTQSGFTGYVNGAVWDATTDLIFATNDNCEVVALRASDGVFVKRDGTTGGTFSASRIVSGVDGDASISGGGGIGVFGDSVLVGSTTISPGISQRRTTALPFKTGGSWTVLGTYPGTASPCWNFCTVGTRVFGALGNGGIGWRYGGITYTDFDHLTTPTITNVDPGVGPHITLTFNSSVAATAPTIGAATDGVGVTGVTQVSTTVVDLNLAIRPDHPVGQADTSTLVPPLGSAENLGPHVPTGVGAIVI
jgi:hypothetical protein